MEFKFSVHPFLKDDITIVDRNNEHLKYSYTRSPLKDVTSYKDELREVINKVGSNSAKAQNLHISITSADQLAVSSDQRCYLLKESAPAWPNGRVIGLLKVGLKKLFFVSPESQQVEVTPLCVLDFYIHESFQRQGQGFKLFSFMLQQEGVTPGCLAIDRPSDKMLSFYKKRFNLSAPIKQPNNFVVFRDFFKCYTATSSKRWTDHQKRGPILLKAINQRQSSSLGTDELKSRLLPEKSSFPAANKAKTPPLKSSSGAHTALTVTPPAELKLSNVLDRPLSSLVAPKASPSLLTRNHVTSREKTFSWSRNNINHNYIVGGGGGSMLLQSRYTNYNRPRPF